MLCLGVGVIAILCILGAIIHIIVKPASRYTYKRGVKKLVKLLVQLNYLL
jgi:hypothetical protein